MEDTKTPLILSSLFSLSRLMWLHRLISETTFL
jgi:hypothetical protein